MNFKNTSIALLMIVSAAMTPVFSADVDVVESAQSQPSKTMQIASEGFSAMREGFSESQAVYHKAMPQFKKVSTGLGVLGITAATVFATYDVTLIYHGWDPITEATTQIMTGGQELVALAPDAYESVSKIATGSVKVVTAGVEWGKKVVATTVNVATQGFEITKKVAVTGFEFAQKGAKMATSFVSNLWSWGSKSQTV